jgi:hypothetical protein
VKYPVCSDQRETRKILADNGVIGVIDNGVFESLISWLGYPVDRMQGFRFRIDFLETLDEEEVEIIRVVDINECKIFEAGLVDFQKHGVPVISNGHLQLSLPMPFWHVTTHTHD